MALTNGNHLFSCKLYEYVVEENPDGNQFLSPLSISTALSMVLAGSRGETEKQILKGLGFENVGHDLHSVFQELLKTLSESGTTKIANALFIENQFKPLPDFVQLVEDNYTAVSTNVNFSSDPSAAASQVNDWVNKATHGKILKIADSFDQDTVMVILNAIYFKSFWANQFKTDNTEEGPFRLNRNDSLNVKLMFQSGKFRYASNDTWECEVLELPYNDKRMSMLIFLPKEVDGLHKVEKSFDPTFLKNVLESLQGESDVDVWLPSFKLEESYSLKSVLSKLGMKDLFSPRQANLKGISETADLYASGVIHKSYVDVNEEGTEAAAVTAVFMVTYCLPQPNIRFRADHPFMFCILENNSQNIIFLGSLKNPKAC